MIEKQKLNRDFKPDSPHEEFREAIIDYIYGLVTNM